MLDLIIPVYNNERGLYRSLMSLGIETNQQIFVTIVDDCSTTIDFDALINFFQQYIPIRVLHLSTNQGPGIARQYGLDHTENPYVAFLDAGDTYCSYTTLPTMLETAINNPDYNMFIWCHSDGNLIAGIPNNRCHGKLYRRDFLQKYNISFCKTSPRANEDIGFNIACRLINMELTKRDNIPHIFTSDEVAVDWTNYDESIVRADDFAFYYRDQNLGLAKNIEHVFQLAEAANVSPEIIAHECYVSMTYEYLCYLNTKYSRPQYLPDALNGALYYYQHIFTKYGELNPSDFPATFYQVLSTFIESDDPICHCLEPLDILGFLNELERITHENLTEN